MFLQLVVVAKQFTHAVIILRMVIGPLKKEKPGHESVKSSRAELEN